MYVNVRFYKPISGGFSGPLYTYRTDRDLLVGDIVEAPTFGGAKKAIVDEICVPREDIKPYVLRNIKTIERTWKEAEQI